MINWILCWIVMAMLIITIAIAGFEKYKNIYVPRWFIVLLIVLTLILLASIIYVVIERIKCDNFIENFIYTNPESGIAQQRDFALARWRVKAHRLPYAWNFYNPKLEQLNYLTRQGDFI